MSSLGIQYNADGIHYSADGIIIADETDPCCCEDLGPPQCECGYSLPASLTMNASSAGITRPSDACSASCSPDTITSINQSGNPCVYQTAEIPGCFGGAYSDNWNITITWDTVLNQWFIAAVYSCADDPDVRVSSAFSGGTDPCDPTGTYTPTSGASGNITVGVP